MTELNPLDLYNKWAVGIFRNNMQAPASWLSSNWGPEDPLFAFVAGQLALAEYQYAERLLHQLEHEKVAGAVVEFGVFEGEWMQVLIEACERGGILRDFYGFDSFEGLPKPTEDDLDCWSEGQYAADFEAVCAKLQCDRRPNVKLVKGWFTETLSRDIARSIDKIAYARVDCDLYRPALECLDWLGPRLTNGAILVFDDWTWNVEKGETRAFREWNERQSGMQFEMLVYNGSGHLYLKVHRL